MNKKFKKVLSIAIALMLVIGMLPMSAVTAVAADDLTVAIDTGVSVTLKDSNADSYYEIGTADELFAFAAAVNGGNTAINGKLTANIDLNPGYTFTFEADTGLVKVTKTVDTTTTVVAYFGSGIAGDTASGENTVFDETASVAGTIYANADDATGDTVDVSAIRLWNHIGKYPSIPYIGTFDGDKHTVSGIYNSSPSDFSISLLGYVEAVGKVKNVTVANSYINGGNYSAAVVGYNCGLVENCSNSAIVTSNTYVGGVVGNNTGTVKGCYNTGIVNSKKQYVGGVVGYSTNLIENCYNIGMVRSASVGVAGVVGYSSGTVQRCYNTGSISGGSSEVGGVVGYSSGTVDNCYNTGTVSGGHMHTGGVVSYNKDGTVKNCYNIGTVTGVRSYVGGVIGTDSGDTSNCYYLKDCATDGAGIVQFGTGYWQTGGGTTADVAGETTAMTLEQFKSGEVAYLLQKAQIAPEGESEIPLVWGQTLGENGDAIPIFGGKRVYAKQCSDVFYDFSNDADTVAVADFHTVSEGVDCTEGYVCTVCSTTVTPDSHTFDDNGFGCLICSAYDGYEAADTDANGIYQIGNIGKLYWFAALVNGDTTVDSDITQNTAANAVLTADIDLTGRYWTVMNSYSGTFDGAGHTIKGMNKISNVDGGQPPFVSTLNSGGKITNVVFNEADQFTQSNPGSTVVAFYNYGTISKVTVSNSTIQLGNYDHVAAICLYNREGGVIENCASINNTLQRRFGRDKIIAGIASSNGGTVQNCYSYGCNFNTTSDSNKFAIVVSGNAPVNCYYYTTANVQDVNATSKTAAQFASGEVAYLLQSGNTTQVWGQDNNQTGALPKFDSTGLYKVVTVGETGNYSVANVGDTNGDGTVDVNDYQAVVNQSLSDNHAQSGTASYNSIIKYDLDGDGYVDVLDVSLIERMINGYKTVDVYAVGDFDQNGVAFEAADIAKLQETIAKATALNTSQKYACDLNADGTVDALDITAAKKYAG